MKIAKFLGNKEINLTDVPKPEIERDTDVIIKVQYCGICGSDVGSYAYPSMLAEPTDLARGELPYAQGHEFTGDIVEMGSAVTRFKIGDRVTAEPLLFCGECESCKTGHYNTCESLSGLGYSQDGAFAEYIVVDEKTVHVIPDEMDYVSGTLIEPTGVSYGAVLDSGIKCSDCCVIFGCGPIGLMSMQAANLMGAKMTICVDIDVNRLNKATEMGATYVIDSSKEDPISKIRELTGNGCDIAIEAAGNNITFNQAVSVCKSHGTIQSVAMYHEPVVINDPVMFNQKELTLKMSSAAYNNRFDDVIDLITKGRLTPQQLISKQIDLDHIQEGLDELMSDKSLYKVIVKCAQ